MKKLFYILSWTWGIIMSLIGAVGAFVLTMAGYPSFKHGGSIVFRIGHNWGGVSLGMFSFVCEEAQEHTLNHEFGHALQNCLYGPLFPFIVAIPSAIRYWQFTINMKKGIPNKEEYDAAWFEGQATNWGTKMAQKWNNI